MKARPIKNFKKNFQRTFKELFKELSKNFQRTFKRTFKELSATTPPSFATMNPVDSNLSFAANTSATDNVANTTKAVKKAGKSNATNTNATGNETNITNVANEGNATANATNTTGASTSAAPAAPSSSALSANVTANTTANKTANTTVNATAHGGAKSVTPSAGTLVPSPTYSHPSAWFAPSPSTELAGVHADANSSGALFDLPIALVSCVVLLCLAAAVFTRGEKIWKGLSRKRGNALLFHKIDDVDEASLELTATRGEQEQKSVSGNSPAKDKQSVELSSMRASVLTSMM